MATPWVTFNYEYPKTEVRLAFFLVTAWDGSPQGLEQQKFAWTRSEKASELGELLPASIPPIRWLSFSPQYAITPDFDKNTDASAIRHYVENAINKGVRLFQFRQTNWPKETAAKDLKVIFDELLQQCRQRGAKLLINSAFPRSWWDLADGVHLRASDAVLFDERPISEDKILGISTHHLVDILYSQRLKADLIVLGHVKNTASHPGVEGMGWSAFEALAKESKCPVYAIGGLSETDLQIARKHHAHGIAAIRAFC